MRSFKSLQHILSFGFKYAISESLSPNTWVDCMWITDPTPRKKPSENYCPDFRRNKKTMSGGWFQWKDKNIINFV